MIYIEFLYIHNLAPLHFHLYASSVRMINEMNNFDTAHITKYF